LTRFEVARLIGARSLQVSLGAPILAKVDDMDSIKIAKAEFKEKIVPITIKRKMPNGEYMVVNIKEAIDNWLIEHSGEI
jgi:DNA-directed RNA polymerase subunit K/omega